MPSEHLTTLAVPLALPLHLVSACRLGRDLVQYCRLSRRFVWEQTAAAAVRRTRSLGEWLRDALWGAAEEVNLDGDDVDPLRGQLPGPLWDALHEKTPAEYLEMEAHLMLAETLFLRIHAELALRDATVSPLGERGGGGLPPPRWVSSRSATCCRGSAPWPRCAAASSVGTTRTPNSCGPRATSTAAARSGRGGARGGSRPWRASDCPRAAAAVPNFGTTTIPWTTMTTTPRTTPPPGTTPGWMVEASVTFSMGHRCAGHRGGTSIPRACCAPSCSTTCCGPPPGAGTRYSTSGGCAGGGCTSIPSTGPCTRAMAWTAPWTSRWCAPSCRISSRGGPATAPAAVMRPSGDDGRPS